MLREERDVRSCNDYILGTDRRMIQNLVVYDKRHNRDHCLVLGCLCGAMPSAHLRYLRKRTRFTINTPNTSDGVDLLFTELRGAIPNPPWQEYPLQTWISLETWRLVNTRIVA